MTRALAFPLVALVLLVGCGSAERTSSNDEDTGTPEPSAATVGDCPVESAAVTGARTIATADLDGDGEGDVVKLTAMGGDCPNMIFARLADRYLSSPLPSGEPPLTSAFGVEVPGREGHLLVTRQDHPRGGFQLRVHAAGDGTLVELETDGHSLVPFVALDVQEHPLSIDCTDGGVVVTEAVAHEPAGGMFAWDIKRTSYALEGTEITPGETVEIADNVLPNQLGAKYPELVRHAAFKSCRTDG